MIDLTKELSLEDERVRLRPLLRTDAGALLEFALNEPELWIYSLIPANGKDNLERYIELALQARESNLALPFLVFDKKTNEVAGSTRFYDYQPIHNAIQLGFTWYGKRFQGTGLNKHCKRLMLQQAFEEWQLDRVEFRADALNQRSIVAMKSIGCVEEGVLRSNCASPTGRRDSIVLSILKDEWHHSVKAKLIASS
ncbi:MAG: GNAT family N-acetyltransferase [Flavobacteriales bacterium]|nr:GNAT family N-acetyltransferase [Flavobacteriales bacterium]